MKIIIFDSRNTNCHIKIQKIDHKVDYELGSVAGPVIQANGRMTFEDDLSSGGLLYILHYTVNQRPH